ncbi:hypothetical protein GIB67_011819 [Kingdonia uniflora]|uniref:Uncharacterized protein n=1 Tax=Kingdonia uniflora TaxID=39325 RepID=A0A7J7NY63_9MAGN|nr:hypothetical protein GIB67_011819 [Kingdonia uniflora]
MAKASADVEELPKAIVRRVVKDKLSNSSEEGQFTLHKDALLAFSESARIFIHYLSATNGLARGYGYGYEISQKTFRKENY